MVRSGRTALLLPTLLALLSCVHGRVLAPEATSAHTHTPVASRPPASHPGPTVLRGRLRYEYRTVRADLLGLGVTETTSARGVPFRVTYRDTQLAQGTTSVTDERAGEFVVVLRQPVPPGTTITFLTVRSTSAGRPLLGVAHGSPTMTATVGSDEESPGPWSWSFPVEPGAGAMGDLTVRVADGSGALQAFEHLRADRDIAATMFARLGPSYRAMPSLVVVWEPGLRFPCGTCYFEGAAGPVRVGRGPRPLWFDTVIWMDGTDATNGVWTPTLLNHEIGHAVMDAYSVIPQYPTELERGMNEREEPAIAWAEGWATFFGHVALSLRAGDAQTRVIYEDDYTYYSLELTTGAYRYPERPRDRLAPADARRGLAQPIADGLVSTILWHLRAVLDDRRMMAALTGPRMVGAYDRGARGRDLVDYLDALVCGGHATRAAVTAVVRGRFGFPYDGRPLCPHDGPPRNRAAAHRRARGVTARLH